MTSLQIVQLIEARFIKKMKITLFTKNIVNKYN